jgi:hypothetical protein
MRFGLMSALVFASLAAAVEVSIVGVPKDIQVHSLNHPTTGVRGYSTFSITGTPTPCVSFWITDADKNTLSLLLTAKTTSKPVTVYYQNDAGAPWGNAAICRVNSLIIP